MNRDCKDSPLADQVSQFLTRLRNGDKQELSSEDKAFLAEHRGEFIEDLITIFSQQIPLLAKGKPPLDGKFFLLAVELAGFLEAVEVFPWIIQFCQLPIEDVENACGDFFVTEELCYLLLNTMGQWEALKQIIEDGDIDEYTRGACLKALVLSVAKGGVERREIVDYFKTLFSKILSGELDDELCTHLVDCCVDFWPGECLEEIKEAYGLTLVDESFIDLDWVVKTFSKGKQSCLEKLQKSIEQHKFFGSFEYGFPPSKEMQEEVVARISELMDQIDIETDQILQKPERNEACQCGSGKKYKKCCMNKSFETSSQIRVERSEVTYDALEEPGPFLSLPEKEKEVISDLYYLLRKNPKKVVKTATKYIEKYPDIPRLYNFLYGGYRMLGFPREAMKVLKKTVELFPDYLFGRIEYAHYLLRRGEPEKAFEALGKAQTLPQLYPERDVFHVSEWKGFAYVMGCYFIEKNDLGQAKIYQEIIEKMAPESQEIEDLKRRMKSKVFAQRMKQREKQALK